MRDIKIGRTRKKIYIMIFVGLIFLIFLGISPYFIIRIKLIGEKEMILDYGEKYSEPGYKASIFGKDITKKIEVSNNIKELGKYKVIYSYKLGFYEIVYKRIIYVEDISAPDIELNANKDYEVTINTEYIEPGYKAIDNLDGDISDKVEIDNQVNINEIGNYKVIYSVSDKHGNKNHVVRNVKVEKKRPTQMSIEEYTLEGWHDSVKLKKTKDYGEEYFNKITMVGDSNTMNMYLNGYLTGKRAWAIPCLHAESMHNIEINLYGLGTKMKLIDAVSKYKPQMLILNFGTFSTSWIDEETFVKNANSIIEKIKVSSPNTKIILTSLFPIREGDNINDFKQETINKYNFLILEMAYNHEIKYLDVQEILKDKSGYANDKYVIDDKFHLTYLGHKVVRDYIKTHAWEE